MFKSQEEADKYIESNRHFILYCKNWYNENGSNNSINDLKKILEVYCGVTNLSNDHIYNKMLEIFTKVVEPSRQKSFWYSLFENYGQLLKGDSITIEEVIKKLKGSIGLCKVSDRDDGFKLNLGDPDYITYSKELFQVY